MRDAFGRRASGSIRSWYNRRMTIAVGRCIALLTLTFAVIAATPPPTTRYDVTLTERLPGAGSERGTLALRIPADGIVTGTYRDFDGNGPYVVSGGQRNGTIWLDYRDVHVTATIGPHGLEGRAFRGGDPAEYVFRARAIP